MCYIIYIDFSSSSLHSTWTIFLFKISLLFHKLLFPSFYLRFAFTFFFFFSFSSLRSFLHYPSSSLSFRSLRSLAFFFSYLSLLGICPYKFPHIHVSFMYVSGICKFIHSHSYSPIQADIWTTKVAYVFFSHAFFHSKSYLVTRNKKGNGTKAWMKMLRFFILDSIPSCWS